MTKQFILSIFAVLLLSLFCQPVSREQLENAVHIPAIPKIDPDYADLTIPPNIAPMNFRILEQGNRYLTRISCGTRTLEISSSDGCIEIKAGTWKKLLRENIGDSIHFTVFAETNGVWKQYRSFANFIAPEPIDAYLTYRLINPAYNLWKEMGIYQRCLESFEEKPILVNSAVDGSCMNCHFPAVQSPENMMMHIRAGRASGTFIYYNGRAMKVNTATDFNTAGAYASWHPDGNLIAFSVNSLMLFFHTTGECRDVVDNASNLIVYDIPRNRVMSDIGISDPERMETFPCWAADGRALYFASAPKISNYMIQKNGQEDFAYNKIFYDLNRITYDPATNTWGKVETLFSGDTYQISAVLPRVSPDGRFLLFTVCDYGSFPIYLKSADLMMLDLQNGKINALDKINSDHTESYHTWSSNGRWITFSSKRRDGLLAQPHFSHVDDLGRVSKPFILPQRNPSFYDSFLKTYNVPELTPFPAAVSPQKIIEVMNNNAQKINADPDPELKNRIPAKTGESNYLNQPG